MRKHILERLTCVCRVTLLLMLISLAVPHSRAVEPPGADMKANLNSIEALLSDGNGYKYYETISKAIAAANPQELSVLKKNLNWGVALQAAWSEWVDDRKGRIGPYDQVRIRDGANRWIGFLEACIHVEPPHEWCDCVRTARYRDLESRAYSDPFKMTPLHFLGDLKMAAIEEKAKAGRGEVIPGLFAPLGVKATKDKNRLSLSFGDSRNVTVQLKSSGGEQLDGLPLNDDDEFQNAALDWFPNNEPQLLVLRRLYFDKCCVIAVSEDGDHIDWSTSVGAVFERAPNTARLSTHAVYVKAANGTLFLFGCCDSCVYVVGLDAKTGKRLAIFSSALW